MSSTSILVIDLTDISSDGQQAKSDEHQRSIKYEGSSAEEESKALTNLRPGLLLMTLEPGVDRRRVLEGLRSAVAPAPVVVFAGRCRDDLVDPFSPEADARLLEGVPPQPLEHVLQLIADIINAHGIRSASIRPSEHARRIASKAPYEPPNRRNPTRAALKLARLTHRQLTVARMVTTGRSSKEIATRLGISRRTVEHHRAKAMRKVGAQSLPELVHLTMSTTLAQLSHDLRTPLNAIMGLAEMTTRQVHGPMSNKKYLEYVDAIYSAGEQILKLVEEIEYLEKIEFSSELPAEND